MSGQGPDHRSRNLIVAAAAAVFAIAVLSVWLVPGAEPIRTPILRLFGDTTPSDADADTDANVAGDASVLMTETAYTEGEPGADANADLTPSSPTDGGTVQAPGQDASDPNPAQGGLPDSMVPPVGAVTFLAVDQAATGSQTYEVSADVAGWQDKASGLLYLRVSSSRLMGPISADTGTEMGEPSASTPDYSSQLEGLMILASTSAGAREKLSRVGDHVLQVVLVPSGQGVVFVVDRVTEAPS